MGATERGKSPNVRVTYRALRRRELTSALEHAGFTNVAWLMPKDTGFYQPVVTARSE